MMTVIFYTIFHNPADGWAIASRAYARAMHAAGVDVRLATWEQPPQQLDPDVARELRGIPIHRPAVPLDDIVIGSAPINLSPAHLGILANTVRLRPPLHRAYYTVFESRSIAPEITTRLRVLDGVWVQCRMNQRVLRDASVESTLIPFPFFEDDPHLALDPPRSTRRFLWIGKQEPRKASDNLIRAFMRAFRPGEAEITLKTGELPAHGQPSLERVLLDELAITTTGWTPRNWRDSIHIITERLSAAEMVELHARHDVYVSASRGEGLDLPAFVAKLAGRRIVTTASGGPEDFLDPDVDILVPSTGVVPAHKSYQWGPSATLIDYSLDDLIAALQRARSQPPCGTRTWPGVEQHRAAAVGERLRSWIESISNKGQRS
jgi:glycosyltransferase involved in cell wall biosynthesis